jgi:hypothetical protein
MHSSSTHPTDTLIPVNTINVSSLDCNQDVVPLRSIKTLMIIITVIAAVIFFLITFLFFLSLWKNIASRKEYSYIRGVFFVFFL